MHELERAERARVLAEAATWLKTPYHHRGRVKGAGADCGTFLAEVFQAAGIVPPIEPGHYPMDWALHKAGPKNERYLAHVTAHAREISPELVAPGDVVVWRYGRTFSHGAIVVAWPRIIHAVNPGGVVYGNAEVERDLARRERKAFSAWPREGRAAP